MDGGEVAGRVTTQVMADTFDLAWLNTLLYAASDTSKDAVRLKASGERYAAASMRAALELNDALKVEGNRASFDAAMVAVLDRPSSAVPAFVTAVPFLLEAERFSAPNGMFDLPNILSTTYFVPRALGGFDVSRHKAMLRTFSKVLVRVQTGFLDRSIETNRDGFVASLADIESWKLPDRIVLRYEETGRDLLPSPAAVVAVLGGDPMVEVANNLAFHKFVSVLNDALWLTAVSSKIWAAGHATPQDEMMVRYLWHMRVFLCDSAERLSLSVLTCDRVPIVAAWYAMTILAARAYAMSLYAAIRKEPSIDPVQFTSFSLVAMAAGDSTGKLPSPAKTLFDAGTKSMYLRNEAQDGPYWVLLRATLSGLNPDQAKAVAQVLCTIDGANPSVCATAVMLCALMRTQAGMAIFSHRSEGADPDNLKSYPLASKAATFVDAVRGQTVFDFVMSTISGTLDLEMLSSDDLAFTAPARMVAVWRKGAAAADDVAKDGPRMNIVEDWCACMTAIGAEWNARIKDEDRAALLPPPKSSDDQGPSREEGLEPLFPAPNVRAATTAEYRDSLDRVAASQASLNHGRWLAMSFKFACLAEETRLPLIKSHIDLNAPASRAMGPDLTADNAWLRLNFRHQSEQVLHSGRRGGMFTAGNHLVLCAWVVVPPMLPSDNGVRIFARTLTTHTVDTINEKARLLSDGWRQTTARRGDDSVVATAIEFERALSQYNTSESADWSSREKKRLEALSKLSKDASKPTEAVLPYVPASSKASHMAAAIAGSVAKFDGSKVQSLDTLTDASLKRFRTAATKQAMTNALFVCQTPFEHGVSVALISSPAQVEEDLRPAREAKFAVQTWKTAEDQRATLLKRLRDFQRGVGSEEAK